MRELGIWIMDHFLIIGPVVAAACLTLAVLMVHQVRKAA